MTSALVILACLILVGALIYLYGKGKLQIGEERKVKSDDVMAHKREAEAKQIESQPAPTTADDVADAWDGMRRP